MGVTPSRLLRKTHLRRWRARALAAAYADCASLGTWRAALHLGLLEQPGQERVFQQPADWKTVENLDARENRGVGPMLP
jgi:hypothetical protein